MTIISATGHRPPKAGLSYSHESSIDLGYVRTVGGALEALEDVEAVIVGGALGWDTLVARAAYIAHIPFWMYVPFEGQEKRWPQKAQDLYWKVRNAASQVKIICEGGYAPHKMQMRNMAMVNDSDEVWALWDGSKGGTANCIEYAEAIGRPIRNFYSSSSLSPIQE